MYLNLDDLGRFLQAVASGELVGKDTLRRLWQPRILPNGRRSAFAAGWEYDQVDAYRYIGHDGGARNRIRFVFDDDRGDVYVFVYLISGSAKNVWSRVPLDSAMAVLAPEQFPREALGEALLRYALEPAAGDAQSKARAILSHTALAGAELERAINAAGYAIRENLGIDPAVRVFVLNTVLFPGSANTWDSLAEAQAASGDLAAARASYKKAQQLAPPVRN